MSGTTVRHDGLDRAAAVTRSLLGWGVVAGGFYLVIGLALALTRERFDLARHQLSLLMLGELGWVQTVNLILSGVMTVAAAMGFARAMRGARGGGWAGVLVGIFGVCLVASGIFPPDPMAGYPDGATTTEGTLSGVLHLAFGAIGFLCLAAAALAVAAWHAQRTEAARARYSRTSAAVVIIGFVGGAILSTQAAGVLALWIAVVTGWGWLAVTSVHLYRTVPHPDIHRRSAEQHT